ncbi:hypothetical protein Taro_002129 [Colocasia esculenta]|uniref:Protein DETOXIFICATION n=1 Tax=Colocasia esculenta TaxID=4460 RepID=A0A843TKQ8_COLES|nr:hypothetical protein [Colocasia esculenta]
MTVWHALFSVSMLSFQRKYVSSNTFRSLRFEVHRPAQIACREACGRVGVGGPPAASSNSSTHPGRSPDTAPTTAYIPKCRQEIQMGGGGEGTKQSLQCPLLTPGYHDKSLEEAGGGRGDGSVEAVGRARKGEVVLAEAKRVVWLAGPLVSASLLQYCLNVISVMFVGHLGELALSGAAMATSFAGVTGFSLLLGMGSAMDTFCGQAFGAGHHYMLGVHMQRAMLVLTLISIPVAFIWASTGDILLLLGQDPEISSEAGLYARWMIPSLFAYGLLQCYVRYLQAQNVVFPMMISSGITTVFHVLMCWILVFKSNLGNKGAALANAISYWINVLLLATYVKFSPACKKTWTGLSKEALNDVLIYIKLAVPSAVMVCLEFWSFEFLVILSGLLPDPTLETSVLSISLNTSTVVFMIPFGLGAAVSTRVSNELGAGSPQGAQLAVCVAVFMVIMEGLTLGLVMILVHTIWGRLYTNDEKVVENVAKIMPLIAISHLMDGVQSVLSGTARGCGWQRIGAFINLGAYQIVGIPSAVLFAFVLHFGGKVGTLDGNYMWPLHASLFANSNYTTDGLEERGKQYLDSSWMHVFSVDKLPFALSLNGKHGIGQKLALQGWNQPAPYLNWDHPGCSSFRNLISQSLISCGYMLQQGMLGTESITPACLWICFRAKTPLKNITAE